jgi:hypothetical protein
MVFVRNNVFAERMGGVMTWRYEQAGHRLSHDGEMITTEGYSGIGADKNNPASENRPFLGPIPKGSYTIGQPIANGGHMGPYVLPLTPFKVNNMFGREGFFIHGDSIDNPGNASNGCIVLNRQWRVMIAQSADDVLVVVG